MFTWQTTTVFADAGMRSSSSSCGAGTTHLPPQVFCVHAIGIIRASTGRPLARYTRHVARKPNPDHDALVELTRKLACEAARAAADSGDLERYEAEQLGDVDDL